jgi:AraC-like DNA-binding protein
MKKPLLNKRIREADFKKYYWLKEQLMHFCKNNQISSTGTKYDLAERIAYYLKTGKTSNPAVTTKKTSSFDWHSESLTPETIITDSYKNSQNVRRFFRAQVGSSFRFSIPLMAFMKRSAGLPLKAAVQEWKRLELLKKDKNHQSVIPDSNQYNLFIRDFMKDNPGESIATARKLWKLKRDLRGDNKHIKSADTSYSRKDLRLLRK